MKIVILSPAYPYRGGIAAFTERLATEYVRQGNDVEIVTFTLQYPSFLFPGKTQYSDAPAPKELKISRMLSSVNPISWIKTGRKIRSLRPDMLIVAHWMSFMVPSLATVCRIVRRNRHTRIVALVHNMLPHEQHFFDKPLAAYFAKSVDAFASMSNLVMNDIALFDTAKPRVCSPHPLYDHYGDIIGRDEALRMLGLSANERYALFFGFIREYKGLDLLIDAFADHRLFDLGVKLIVAGEFYGDPQPHIDRIKRLDLTDRIILCNDYIPDPEVNRYFCAADCVVLPYRSATQSGITQTAMYFERPMIATNVGGLPDIVHDGETGLVVNVDAQSIADALVRFFRDGLADQLSAKVREEKKKYAWSNFVEAVNSLIPNK